MAVDKIIIVVLCIKEIHNVIVYKVFIIKYIRL